MKSKIALLIAVMLTGITSSTQPAFRTTSKALSKQEIQELKKILTDHIDCYRHEAANLRNSVIRNIMQQYKARFMMLCYPTKANCEKQSQIYNRLQDITLAYRYRLLKSELNRSHAEIDLIDLEALSNLSKLGLDIKHDLAKFQIKYDISSRRNPENTKKDKKQNSDKN